MTGNFRCNILYIAALSFVFSCGNGGNSSPGNDLGETDADVPGWLIRHPVPGQDGACSQEQKAKCYDSNPCTEDICLPYTFVCEHKTLPKDGNACTTGDRCVTEATCLAGVCEVKAIKTCASLDPCRISECEPAHGVCVLADNSPFGTPCEDGYACTVGDRCESGQCTSGVLLECDDNNPCTEDACDPESGTCKNHALTAAGAQCDDSNECTLDSCDVQTGGCVHDSDALNGVECDEDNLCTNVGTCNVGICNSQPTIFCGDGQICTADVCDPETGTCSYPTGPTNGLTCDDGNPCTDDGKCTNGFCIPGQQKTCNDANPCTQDVCYQSTGCCVNNYYIYDGIACDDGDICTAPGSCDLGSCIAGDPIAGCCLSAGDCDDSNPCTVNHCVNHQCAFVSIPVSGCCDGDTLKKCMNGDIFEEFCSSESCGWNGSQNGCDTEGNEGPIDLNCAEPECTPHCVGKACGSDGCDGSCGSCEAGFVCGPAFSCLSSESLEVDFGSTAVRNALDPDNDGTVSEYTDVILPNGVQVVVTTEAQISNLGIWGSAPFCIQGVWLMMPASMAYATEAHNSTLTTYNHANAPTEGASEDSGLPGKISIHTWAGQTFDDIELTEVAIPFWSEDGLSLLEFQTPAPLKVLQLHFGENGTTFEKITVD